MLTGNGRTVGRFAEAVSWRMDAGCLARSGVVELLLEPVDELLTELIDHVEPRAAFGLAARPVRPNGDSSDGSDG